MKNRSWYFFLGPYFIQTFTIIAFYTFNILASLVKYKGRTKLILISKFSVRIEDFINVTANIWKIIDLKQTLKDCFQCLIFTFFVLIRRLKTCGLEAKNNLEPLHNNIRKLIGIFIVYTSQARRSKKVRRHQNTIVLNSR